MRRLILLRHAKSDWSAAAASDHDRPLNPRGERAARAMGELITRAGEVPDLVITSSALRARSTVEMAAGSGGWSSEVQVTEALYDTTIAAALEVAGGAPDSVGRLMLVGHEPVWSGLIHHLTGGSVQMKAGSAAGIDLDVEGWGGAPHAGGALAYLLPPRLFTHPA